MKWVIIIVTAIATLLLGGGWLGGRGADNSDSQALATIFYLPGLAFAALDIALLVGWGIWRLFTT